MKQKELEKRTREVFHKIHVEQGNDKVIFKRLTSLLSQEYLQVNDDFFKNKICLDAGCGSNANATYKMLQIGAKKVYCFDTDSTILKTIPTYLKEFEGKYIISIDNVLHMKFPNDSFDFVHCSGVLHHTGDIFKGLKELARVTKKGGILFVLINGKGNLIGNMTKFFRTKYKNDINFHNFVDNLSPKFFLDLSDFISSSMREKNDDYTLKLDKQFKDLFDKDLILTIKDRIQAPTYSETTEAEIIKHLQEYGFSDIQRITKYPTYKNIRRFLSPFYYKYDNPFSRLLYGEGIIQIKAFKNK